MKRIALLLALALFCPLGASAQDKPATSKKPAPSAIGHMVYFKLKDASPAAREKLIAACKKSLAEHEGVVFFSAGPIAANFQREVNDRDWDVGLHMVFASLAAHDKYQDHPEHLKFIEENKNNWAKVRVFDSKLAGMKLGARKPKANK